MLGNGSQRHRFLSFRVLRLLFSLAGLYLTSKLQVKVTLRLSFRRQLILVFVSCSIWVTRPHFSYYQVAAFLSMCDALFDERAVLSFTTAAGLAGSVILRSESRRTHDHILLSQLLNSPNQEGFVPITIFPRNRVAQLQPRHRVAFSSPRKTRRVTMEVFGTRLREGGDTVVQRVFTDRTKTHILAVPLL
jgi:hypothetical protein